MSVSRGSIESSVSALGTLQPRRYVDVGAQASGQIRKLHVEAGDDVTEGQLLVEIDPSTQQAKVDAGRYSIEMLKAQLAEQRAQYTLARQQYQRQQRLAAGGATRTEDVQSAQAQMLATQARIEMYQAQIRQAQASLRSDEAELGYTRIYAPMSGTVVAVDAREGQTLNAQQQTPLILRIAKLSPMTVWAQVSEADIGRVKPGMPAYFTTLSGEGRRWTGKVRQILPVPPKPLDQSNQGGGSHQRQRRAERQRPGGAVYRAGRRGQRRPPTDGGNDRPGVLRRRHRGKHPHRAGRRHPRRRQGAARSPGWSAATASRRAARSGPASATACGYRCLPAWRKATAC